jgi:drug/metabolite transporter (DMT)-like permease
MPKGKDIPLLALGIFGIGTSGPLIAGSKMPIPTLIFWRNLGGTVLLLPFALKKREWITAEQRGALKTAAISGFLLGLHFLAFFAAMRYTTVATGTALTCLQPIFAAVFVAMQGHVIPRRSWSGMAIAFASVLLITGLDLSLSGKYFVGDIAGILAGALAAGYMLFGAKAQKNISTSTFAVVCYLSCALTALAAGLIFKVQIWGFPKREWVITALLILGAQILGHTMFNMSLKRVSPVVVSLIIFFEVPVSAVIAAIWLDQKPSAGIIPGIIGLLIGCAIFVTRSSSND